ncbi:hypothetical protein HDV05_002715 [Chytridiales sp. JEL 0842]|nr:hypothetical protein HDV05_002715 [Chytridiales sp. JEL 0842]
MIPSELKQKRHPKPPEDVTDIEMLMKDGADVEMRETELEDSKLTTTRRTTAARPPSSSPDNVIPQPNNIHSNNNNNSNKHSKRNVVPRDPSLNPSLSRLEPPAGARLLAFWLDPNSDTPTSLLSRLPNLPPTAYHYTQTLPLTQPPPPFSQLDTHPTASLYLSLIPTVPLSSISDLDLLPLAHQILELNKHGRKVYLRVGGDMNVPWVVYGQQPIAFQAFWRRVWESVRGVLGAATVEENNKSRKVGVESAGGGGGGGVNYNEWTAFVWAPRVGYGFPWRDTFVHASGNGGVPGREFVAMDTNGDGRLDGLDDPYAPYYPETGAAYFVKPSPSATEPTESQIKRAWWTQFLTNNTFFSNFPLTKFVCLTDNTFQPVQPTPRPPAWNHVLPFGGPLNPRAETSHVWMDWTLTNNSTPLKSTTLQTLREDLETVKGLYTLADHPDASLLSKGKPWIWPSYLDSNDASGFPVYTTTTTTSDSPAPSPPFYETVQTSTATLKDTSASSSSSSNFFARQGSIWIFALIPLGLAIGWGLWTCLRNWRNKSRQVGTEKRDEEEEEEMALRRYIAANPGAVDGGMIQVPPRLLVGDLGLQGGGAATATATSPTQTLPPQEIRVGASEMIWAVAAGSLERAVGTLLQRRGVDDGSRSESSFEEEEEEEEEGRDPDAIVPSTTSPALFHEPCSILFAASTLTRSVFISTFINADFAKNSKVDTGPEDSFPEPTYTQTFIEFSTTEGRVRGPYRGDFRSLRNRK